MLGASQNIALPNTVLNTAVAESLRRFADRLEKAENFDREVAALIKETFAAHRRILFDGNGYSDDWEKEAEKRGLSNLRTSVDAFHAFMTEKNVALFSTLGVMSETEMRSREEIYFENYAKIINIEAQTMTVMASRDYIPAVEKYIAEIADTAAKKKALSKDLSCKMELELVKRLSDLNLKAWETTERLQKAETEAASIACAKDRADRYCYTVLPIMEELRAAVDEMETLTSSKAWPVPTYGDMMFRV